MNIYSLRPPWPNQAIERKALLRFVELHYRLAVNQPARISARLVPPADVALNDLIELVRDGEREALAYVTEVSSDGLTLGVEAVGVLGILGWRHVLYFAGTAGRSYFTNTPAETLVKTIVATNIGSQAVTSQGRLTNGAVSWFAVEADAGRGPTIASRGCAWRNVLDECVEIAEQAQADLAVVQVGNALELRYIPRPSSPEPSHIFSPAFGNVDSYELRRIAHEASRVVAAGQGEASDRQYAIATLAGAPPPLREYVKHATWDGAQLGEEAQAELAQRKPRLEVRWRAAQTVGSRYWRDYRLGDYVRVQIEDYIATHRITAIGVTMTGAREDIEIETTPI
jgi:hypothetical protein